MNTFRNYADYEIPLLQVLNDLPGGQGTSRDVRDRFGERFDDCIPDEHRVYLENAREAKWRNIVAWVRSGLIKRGLMDSPAYGIWRITDAGRAYLVQDRPSAQPVDAPIHTAQPPQNAAADAEAHADDASAEDDEDLIKDLAEAEFLPAVRDELESWLSRWGFTPLFDFPQDDILQVRFSAPAVFYYQLHLLASSVEFELYFEDTPRLNDACRQALQSHQYKLNENWEERLVIEKAAGEYTRAFLEKARTPFFLTTLSAQECALTLITLIIQTRRILTAVLDREDSIDAKPRVDELNKAAFIERVRADLDEQIVKSGLHATAKAPWEQLLHVDFLAYSGCHYAVWVHAHTIEVGLHFQSSRKLNHARLERFLPHQEALSKALGEQVRAEKWGENAARVVYELPRPTLSATVATEFAGRLIALIRETLPILREAIAGKAERPRVEARSEPPTRAHAIIDTQIVTIRDFLNGRASRPSDERLCDWVHLCYEFELYREGRDLFALVDPTQVNPWYYERAKRSAKVCAMKVAGHA